MGTATKSTITKFTPDDPQVYHPLDRLRGIIQRYVVIEGILSTLIFLVVWYALAMVLDFGVFKALTWDWAQDGTVWIRGLALAAAVLLLVVILVTRIAIRLTRELTYPALALVLERRFPKVLGDRLITAVELADIKKSAQYGYSASMIRQTIEEARERVGTVPVNEVFNWRRLQLMGVFVIGMMVLFVAVAFASHALSTGSFRPLHASWKLVNVSTILAERDLFLQNTPWPRRALLELDPEIKETGLRVARDGVAPHVRVKSFQWVIADRSVRDGWRPMHWSDVTEEKLGVRVPEFPLTSLSLPDEKVPLPVDPASWTVDAVWNRTHENAAVQDNLAKVMGSENYQALQAVFQRLDEIAADPAKERYLRHLEIPRTVSFDYAGAHTSGGGPLTAESKTDYAGEIQGLREDVSFVIRAEDYRTPPRAITLIPPPSLVKLTRVEYQPAYLYYMPPLGPNQQPLGPSSLKGKLQTMPEEKLSLTGANSIFVVPAGTEVVITGTTELPIAKAFAQPKVGKVPGAAGGSASLVPLKLIDENTFAIEFRGESRVSSAVEFDLVFENADKVVSKRTVMIQVTDDQAPIVEVAPEFLRRIGPVYYVTRKAKIPFNPDSSISDDNGLSKVEYTSTHWVAESAEIRAMRCGLVTASLVAPGGLSSSAFPSVVQGAFHANAVRTVNAGDSRISGSYPVRAFTDSVAKLSPVTEASLEQLLAEPWKGPRPDLVRKTELKSNLRAEATRSRSGALENFKWIIDGAYFDVRALKFDDDASEIQSRYLIELNVKATDSNFDTGPKFSTNPEPIRLMVVSQSDLLYEISKDEEVLGGKLDEAIKRIEAAKKKFEFVRSKNGFAGLEEVDPVKVRCKDASQDLAKAMEIVQTVLRESRRIEKECIYNQLDEKTIVSYGFTANRIDRVLGENPFAVSPEEDRALAVQDEKIRAGQDGPRPTFPMTEKLMTLVQGALDERRWADSVLVANTENAIQRLLSELVAIRQMNSERESIEKLRREFNFLVEQQRRVKSELSKWHSIWVTQWTKDTPEIFPVGQVFLVKGESKKIQHTIKWRQYKEDNLTVKLESSDQTAVIVPPELKLDFEKNDLNFDYEIRAGNKVGDFTVTLAPAVGSKVEIKVTVR